MNIVALDSTNPELDEIPEAGVSRPESASEDLLRRDLGKRKSAGEVEQTVEPDCGGKWEGTSGSLLSAPVL